MKSRIRVVTHAPRLQWQNTLQYCKGQESSYLMERKTNRERETLSQNNGALEVGASW